MRRQMEVLEMLAASGADLNACNKNEETPADICEDAEIRQRIEQLKTEQESKRQAEAQRKRVRRSQSNNTRYAERDVCSSTRVPRRSRSPFAHFGVPTTAVCVLLCVCFLCIAR